jgi:hypothetical protein
MYIMVRSAFLGRRAGARVVAKAGVLCSGAAAALVASLPAYASGGAENALLVIDPSNAVSLYVGNYYKNARNIPDSNVLYLTPGAAANYQEWVNTNQAAFLATLQQRVISDHIDYVVIAPSSTFFVSAPGLVADTCSPVARFSIGSVFEMSYISSEILAGGNTIMLSNRYYNATDSPIAFDSSQAYLNGIPSSAGTARRYFIAGLLGHNSAITGNTVPQILANIDRSVAVDGTRPFASGTFYYMNTSDPNRNVRQGTYATAVASLTARGAMAAQVNGSLPPAGSSCMGIMTGVATVDVPPSGITIQPGAFCDHLTSYAATFDIAAQTKVSHWIANGASGSAGTVEEPCNYPGKFPHARLHVWYAQGLTLGEAYLRSLQYVPFQGLFYGDPLTRPFAHIPVVSVPDAPTGVVSGAITLTPSATTTNPGAMVTVFDLLVDGAFVQSIAANQQFTLDTTTLADGWHDLRVVGRDNSFQKFQGRFATTFMSSNAGRSATLGVAPASGDLLQSFQFTFGSAGGAVDEVRLLQGGRVIAASADPSGSISVFGQNLGAGPSSVIAEALFADGRRARSAPVSVNVTSSGSTTTGAPVAFSYTKSLPTPTAYVVELPAAFAQAPADVTYTLLSGPAQATVLNAAQAGPYRIIQPNPNAMGSEQITFRVSHPAAGNSNTATVTLVYTPPGVCPPDWNHDHTLNSQDFFDFLNDFFAVNADYNQDMVTNSQDFFDFLGDFFAGC